MSEPIAESLHVLFPVDVALARLGVTFDEHPASPLGEWPQHLRWGADSACQVERMLLAGNLMGAAAVARTQLERWSENRAYSNRITRGEDVSLADHYTLVWHDESPPQDAGAIWSSLSEVLHGRGSMYDAVAWEASDGADAREVHRVEGPAALLQIAVQLSLRQVLICVATLLEKQFSQRELARAIRTLPLALPSEVTLSEAAASVWPLSFEHLTELGLRLSHIGDDYIRDILQLSRHQAPRDLPYSARSLEAFASRRARAATSARLAFDAERERLGDNFDPMVLQRREFAYIVINETAGLLGRWSSDGSSMAFAAGASALRAAYWLWLEDDDRSMVLARTVLEQAARLRTWRTRPDRAAIIESKGSRTRVRDWLAAAGWRRLHILNRALGEFAHASPRRARWSGAREVLMDIQSERSTNSHPELTVRGDTLDDVAFSFGMEVMAAAKVRYTVLSAALEEVLPPSEGEESKALVNDWLERCWQRRQRSFGSPDFEVPPDA